MRRHIPESPRWLIRQGKFAAAEMIINNAEQFVKKNGDQSIETGVK